LVPFEFTTSPQSPRTANEKDWLEPAGICEKKVGEESVLSRSICGLLPR
jgi:hypothetical protein